MKRIKLEKHLTSRLLIPIAIGFPAIFFFIIMAINQHTETLLVDRVKARAYELAETLSLVIESRSHSSLIISTANSVGTFEDVDLIIVVDDSNKQVIASNKNQLVNQSVDTIALEKIKNYLVPAVGSSNHTFSKYGKDRYVLVYKAPIARSQSTSLSYLSIGIFLHSQQNVRIIEDYTDSIYLVIAVSIGVLIIAYAFIIRRIILIPLAQLNRSITDSREQDKPCLSHYQSTDEIGQLTQTYNNMIAAHYERQEALEQARQLSEAAAQAKSDFLATMTHEIRTPLNGVLGANELLMQSSLNKEQQEYVHLIKSSGTLLLAVVNDILDFSKIEAGKLELSKESIELKDILTDVSSIFQFDANHKGLSLFVNLPTESIPPLWGDGIRIRQIMINLLNNAVKFTDTGHIEVKLVIKEKSATRILIQISVVDTGIGIEADKIDLLFEKFTQADSSTTRKYGGTGLGLSICKELIELMEGEITVSSRPGQGTQFNIDLAFPIVDEKISAPTPAAPLPSTKSLSILIAEDTEVNRIIITKILQTQGHEALCVNNGQEAVEILSRENFDLIIMDCQMPVMDGFEATRQIRKMNKDIPIIALTAGATQETKDRCLASGMDLFLTKPIAPHLLQEALSSFT
ncbi:ATP-binding protein [Pleionea sp. CnH1-48]|uniref:ATP-binding protein n=1 Tax=Pleionea sp. CnH1-48 TaxID=2954494 RepID=UPI00209797D4|nr:ATP-binding protein [Pleionea sp. CnH1-48]MCO7225229.1 ATP-binding protein [Pleionea sp. CnH1-48]